MIISQVNSSTSDAHLTISAKIQWEENARETGVFHYSIPERFSDLVGDIPSAFLTAALVPALSNQEKRILIEAPVDPTLLDNLEEAMFWLRAWNRRKYLAVPPPRLEADICNPDTNSAAHSAMFLSGGVDAYYSLLHNLSRFPPSHPARVRYGILVYGFSIGGRSLEYNSREADLAFDTLYSAISTVCDEYEIEILPVRTNIRQLDDRPGFWGNEFVAAALSSCAHLVNQGIGNFYLSSAGEPMSDSGDLSHFGTHPILDHCYSSFNTRIRHYLAHHDSRIGRLETLSKHISVINNMQVCHFPPPDRLNCGACEKCIRTMLMLDLLGALTATSAFEGAVMSSKLLRTVSIDCDSVEAMYIEMLSLARKKCYPYINDIVAILSKYEKYRLWRDEKNFAGRLKKLDRKFLNSYLWKKFRATG